MKKFIIFFVGQRKNKQYLTPDRVVNDAFNILQEYINYQNTTWYTNLCIQCVSYRL